MEKVKNSIENYSKGFPLETQTVLEKIRVIIRKNAPEAEETIKYGIPTFTMNGNLVHFAAYKNHIILRPVLLMLSKRNFRFTKAPKVRFNFLLIPQSLLN